MLTTTELSLFLPSKITRVAFKETAAWLADAASAHANAAPAANRFAFISGSAREEKEAAAAKAPLPIDASQIGRRLAYS
ncbi:hypothetical protein ACTHR6_02415 [Ralstonia holmesii]|uniref:hypothetical protein n=1 Tax=Ralstonia TaxID=48736 RepID=UPI001EF849BD|nr:MULTISPECIES: hypothetical protein [Ralstonia]